MPLDPVNRSNPHPPNTITNVDLYSLQKGDPAARDRGIADQLSITDLAAQCNDLADLAAAISLLDLIVTIDTGPAYLAGRRRPTHLASPIPRLRLALDAQPRRFALVSKHASLPPAQAVRLGSGRRRSRHRVGRSSKIASPMTLHLCPIFVPRRRPGQTRHRIRHRGSRAPTSSNTSASISVHEQRSADPMVDQPADPPVLPAFIATCVARFGKAANRPRTLRR